jgi:hypothetical protein
MKAKRKNVNIKQYNKAIDKIIKKDLEVHEKLIKMLEYASSVHITE